MKKEKFDKYYANNEHFRLTNPNPRWKEQKGYVWHTGDCVIRAFANAAGIGWIEAFDFLTERARKEFSTPNELHDSRRWLVENGAVWHFLKPERGKKRMTCIEFAKTHPTGRYIINVNYHDTACVDGVLLDAWNPSDEYVYGYLDMENFKL